MSSQLLRFVLVGAINTVFSYSIYAGLIFLGIGYAIANLVALIMGILFSFKTQGHLVFRNPRNRLLGRFVLAWAFIYVTTVALIGHLIHHGFDPYTSGILALPFSTVSSYLIQKYFVFRVTHSPTSNDTAPQPHTSSSDSAP